MFDPISTNAPAEAISYALVWLRDLSIFGGVLIVGWKSRDLYQDVKDFTAAITCHMTKMESFAQVVVENHLKHIEQDMATLVRRRSPETDESREL